MKITVPLEKFIGQHTLTGMSNDSIPEAGEYGQVEECQVVRFTIDGVHFEAVQDPNDGYRSSLREVRISKNPPAVSIDPVRVEAVMRNAPNDEVLQFVNVKTRKPIIEIGTSEANDYYPGFVGEIHPENVNTPTCPHCGQVMP